MANVNYRQIALDTLNLTLADLRSDASARQQVIDLAETLAAENRRSRETDTLKQSTVATVLAQFAGFQDDPNQYGPTTAQVHETLVEAGYTCKRNAIAQHLAKMRNAGVIESMRMLETSGVRGAPPVFFYLAPGQESRYTDICNGDLVCK